MALLKRLFGATSGKLTYASAITLVLGLVSELAGFDIAPTEVDAVVTFVATVGVLYGRWRATRVTP